MKQKDIALIVMITVIGAVISYFVSGMLFGGAATRQQEVEVVQPISADFTKPDSNYFNEKSINITKPITIGQQGNSDPFSGSAQ